MIRTKLIGVIIFSFLISSSSSAFFEDTLRFLTGIDLKKGTQMPTLGVATSATNSENNIQSLARRLLLQMAPYFIINHQARAEEEALLGELHQLLDERTLVLERIQGRAEHPAAPESLRPLADLVQAAEEGEPAARGEIVHMLFLGIREFAHLNARIRYAGLYILAFNGWAEAAAQIEIIHREGHLDQPRWPLQGETLRMLFHYHQEPLGSR